MDFIHQGFWLKISKCGNFPREMVDGRISKELGLVAKRKFDDRWSGRLKWQRIWFGKNTSLTIDGQWFRRRPNIAKYFHPLTEIVDGRWVNGRA
jgi:hypothetical protein